MKNINLAILIAIMFFCVSKANAAGYMTPGSGGYIKVMKGGSWTSQPGYTFDTTMAPGCGSPGDSNRIFYTWWLPKKNIQLVRTQVYCINCNLSEDEWYYWRINGSTRVWNTNCDFEGPQNNHYRCEKNVGTVTYNQSGGSHPYEGDNWMKLYWEADRDITGADWGTYIWKPLIGTTSPNCD